MNKLLLFMGALFLCASGKSQVMQYPCQGLDNFIFANTINTPSFGYLDCLDTTPNATLFNLGTISSGDVEIILRQASDFNPASNTLLGNILDADFICFGPFTHPVSSIEEAITGNVVDCSYSADYFETCEIPNTQPGQFYALIITNFSNSNGYIQIQTETEFLCEENGFNLKAFLDSNSNGVKDEGEAPFPYGTFYFYNENYAANYLGFAEVWAWAYDPSATFNFYFTVLESQNDFYTVATPAYTNVPVNGITDITFAVQPVTPFTDLGVSIVPLNDPMPGFTYRQKIIVTNYGTQPSPGTLHFEKDTALPQPLVTD